MLRDRLPGAEADADPQRHRHFAFGALAEGKLDFAGALHGVGGSDEGTHDAIASVLDLLAPLSLQRVADDAVMETNQVHAGLVPQALGERGGTLDVGEEDRAYGGVEFAAGQGGGGLRYRRAHEARDIVHLHFDDLIGEQPVGLAMDGDGSLGVGGVDEAEGFLGRFAEPVSQVLDLILVLHRFVQGMGFLQVRPADPRAELMHVHEKSHCLLVPPPTLAIS